MTAEFNTLSVIILFGILQGLVLLYLFLFKKPKGYKYVSLFIFSIIVQEVEAFLHNSGYMLYTVHLVYFSLPFTFLTGPSLLGYSYTLLDKKIRFKNIVLHTLPFILYFFYCFLYFLQPVEKKKYDYVTSVNPEKIIPFVKSSFNVDPLNIHGFVVVEFIGIHLIIYGLWGLFVLYKKKRNKNLFWLKVLNSISLISGFILLLSEGGVVEGFILYNSILPPYMSRIYAVLSLYIVMIFLLKSSKYFNSSEKSKYEKSSLTNDLKKVKLKKIMNVIEEDKSYLEQSFSLHMLASKVNMPINHVTEVINTELKMSFYELTNSLRIKKAKELLGDPSNKDMKIEQLAYAVGYKSKSAFYNSFKKEVNLTPFKYKKTLNTKKK